MSFLWGTANKKSKLYKEKEKLRKGKFVLFRGKSQGDPYAEHR
ncbi:MULTISPECIES: hypothetical protein [unclassified Fibrobacter]|nr:MULTISPECIES: hypothetical protein [Fibrobacter]MDO4946948.1 hypothetical protein [Fibrobacter sp.]